MVFQSFYSGSCKGVAVIVSLLSLYSKTFEIDTIASFVILVELAFLLYHMMRMSKQDKYIQDLIIRFDKHCDKLDAYSKQMVEKTADLDARIKALDKKT